LEAGQLIGVAEAVELDALVVVVVLMLVLVLVLVVVVVVALLLVDPTPNAGFETEEAGVAELREVLDGGPAAILV